MLKFLKDLCFLNAWIDLEAVCFFRLPKKHDLIFCVYLDKVLFFLQPRAFYIFLSSPWKKKTYGPCHAKHCFGHMRTVKAQISLHSHSQILSADRIIGYCRMYEWSAKAWMILYASMEWSESAYFAHIGRRFFRLMWSICCVCITRALVRNK